MSANNQFIPRMGSSVERQNNGKVTTDTGQATDSILYRTAQYAVVALFFLTPLFFVPGLWASLGFDKALLLVIFSAVIVVLLSFLALRKQNANTTVPLSLLTFWALVAVALISAFNSGDSTDALRGSSLEVQTAGFILVLGVVMSITLVLQKAKKMTLFALFGFGLAAIILFAYNAVRFIAGADFLSLGSFNAVTVSPIGNLNDLAVFTGAVIIFGLITLVQLPIKRFLQTIVTLVIAVGLCLLMVIDFFSIWVILGLFGLLMLVYLLTKDTLFTANTSLQDPTKNNIAIAVAVAICLVSGIFIFAGNLANNVVSQVVSIDYVQVTPSHQATIDIARQVYQEDALLGVGPNRFADAWRFYKDESINSTIFWDSDFPAGSGYVSTAFVTLGLLGGVILLLFHVLLIYLGYKMLLRTDRTDSYWYYLGSVSFAVAVFIWAVSYVYQPGAAVLIIASLFTGLTYVAASFLLPATNREVALVTNRRMGFFLMAVVVILIPITALSVLAVAKQYSAQVGFNQASSNSEAEFESVATNAFATFPDDRFMNVLAQVHLANLNSILRTTDPSETDRQAFLEEAEKVKRYSDQAINQDHTNPDNYAILAGLYSSLAMAGVGEAQNQANNALAEAKRLDPLNPGYSLMSAQIAANMGDWDQAREKVDESLSLKPNFTPALFLSAQLDINDGDVESAIETTRSLIALEPNNPTRYLQMGMLLASDDRHEEAVAAFNAAIQLDNEYANARYLMALSLLELDETEAALEQLKIVESTNPDNQQLLALIEQIESGDTVESPDLGYEPPLEETSTDNEFDDTVTSPGDTETDLITPVNTVDDSGEEEPVE